MSQLKQKLYDPLRYRLDSFRFFIRKHLTKNLSSKYLFKKNSIKLTEIQNDILESIKKKGFAKSSLKELFNNSDQILDNFLSTVESLKKTDDYKNSVNFFNKNFVKPDNVKLKNMKTKQRMAIV